MRDSHTCTTATGKKQRQQQRMHAHTDTNSDRERGRDIEPNTNQRNANQLRANFLLSSFNTIQHIRATHAKAYSRRSDSSLKKLHTLTHSHTARCVSFNKTYVLRLVYVGLFSQSRRGLCACVCCFFFSSHHEIIQEEQISHNTIAFVYSEKTWMMAVRMCCVYDYDL